MSKVKRPNPNWKKFELLLRRIEEIHAPSGAQVKSPDFLPDLVTGSLREVDATIRFLVGTVEVIVGFECRKRATKADVTWIEQLSEKRMSLGLDSLVAVSSKGFTAEAMRKAMQKGIKTRVLRNVENFDTTSAIQLELKGGDAEFKNLVIDVEGSDFVGLEASIQSNVPLFQIWDESKLINLQELLFLVIRTGVEDGEIPPYQNEPNQTRVFFEFDFKVRRLGMIKVLNKGSLSPVTRIRASVIVKVLNIKLTEFERHEYIKNDTGSISTYSRFYGGRADAPEFDIVFSTRFRRNED